MMTIETKPFIVEDHILTAEDALGFIEAAFEEVQPENFLSIIRSVADTKGMTELAKKAGLSRSGLYKALSDDGDPRLSTVFAILNALGLRMSLHPIEQGDAA